MRVLATLSHIIAALCILTIVTLIVPMIWGIYPPNEFVGKLLLSLGTIYVSMLLIGGMGNSDKG